MLEIRTADELVDPELEARWALRRVARQADVLRHVLQAFVERPGPVSVDAIFAVLTDWPPQTVRDSLSKMDEDDLIQLEDDRVQIAYPFSARPTPFVVRLARGHERFACCAIDALGIAPMAGQAVQVRAGCHHCGSSLEFTVTPDGPGPQAQGVMVWVGKRCEGQQRITTSL
ncbi:MAG: hypothetical protein HY613_00665 [Candidatus Rokubacteria bacterium]|nr:hypothetical protein [Candidatus Rokubacteria bacterium]